MKYRAVNLIYFSPTKTTEKIVKTISSELGLSVTSDINLTYPRFIMETEISTKSISIIGVPVYAGRIPVTAYERIKKINGNDTLAVIVVVYGNRDYEDALIELKEVSREIGFVPFAGATFIGEHSFSNETKPIAKGRPDDEDIQKARDFGRRIREKLRSNNFKCLTVNGNYPLKEPMRKMDFSPETDNEKCSRCGQCITACPTEAIELKDEIKSNQNECILCFACVKFCPENARYVDEPNINSFIDLLHTTCSERKEPEFFI